MPVCVVIVQVSMLEHDAGFGVFCIVDFEAYRS